MNCPRCQSTLQTVVIPEAKFNLEVDQCPECKGIWFDQNELQAIENVIEPVLFEIRQIPSEYDQLTALHCPFCEDHPRMAKAEHQRDEQVIMDICEQCNGIWLDGGELEAIQKENWLTTLFNLFKKL